MGGRKYIVVIVLSWITTILWGWFLFYDFPRMDQAEIDHKEELASIGAILFARNCVLCHGPVGEGVVGPPLDREAFRGDPSKDKDVYDLIYRTINNGRPGTSIPRWVLLENGEFASYTSMPAWGLDNGGAMNPQELTALAHFIMMGDWKQVNRHIPPPNPWIDEEGRVLWDNLPDGEGISEEASRQGKELFVNRGCIGCHTLGTAGGMVGPNLSDIGAWGVDEDFLKRWIKDPAGVTVRAPRYFSNYGGPTELPLAFVPGAEENRGALDGQRSPDIDELPLTQMPALNLTDDEIETLVNYLIHLK